MFNRSPNKRWRCSTLALAYSSPTEQYAIPSHAPEIKWERGFVPLHSTSGGAVPSLQLSGLQYLSSTDLAYMRNLCQAFLSRLADGLGNLLGTITQDRQRPYLLFTWRSSYNETIQCSPNQQVHPGKRKRGHPEYSQSRLFLSSFTFPLPWSAGPRQSVGVLPWHYSTCFFGGPAIGLRAGEKREKTDNMG